MWAMSEGHRLTGRTALVTGSGRRLGQAFALGLAEAGADLAVHFHGSDEGAQETAAKVRALGRRAELFQADLGDVQQAIELISRVARVLAGLDILVNSASIFEPLTAEATDLDAWVRHMRVNLTAPFFLTQALARYLAGQPGSVVNVLDWRALHPGPDHVPYTISKAGLAAATSSLAQAYAPALRVNALALGAILPPSDGGSDFPDLPIQGVPAGRWGTVDEAVAGLLFLITGPSYMTGQVVAIDGGRHLI
jgi:NAD(P)-dependent dehydrogenase (short-subunit alcohol dehydrogenase family)